jgi:uncharacterized membrane protein
MEGYEWVMHWGYYICLIVFCIYHRKELWKAAKGGNGILQTMEVLKFLFIFISLAYAIEVIFSGVQFDLAFGMWVAMMIGVANVGDVQNYFNKKDKKE